SVALGSTVHDSATVSGIPAFVPTGDVTFTFYTASSGCTGASVGAGTVALDAGGGADPADAEGPLAAGSYSFQAHYNGDSNYNERMSDCEPLSVGGSSTSTATAIHDDQEKVVTSVPLGSTVHDSATVSGQIDGIAITGDVSFTFFSNGTCDGTGADAGTVT